MLDNVFLIISFLILLTAIVTHDKWSYKEMYHTSSIYVVPFSNGKTWSQFHKEIENNKLFQTSRVVNKI